MSQWIPEFGIYDYRNRIYNPDQGRFMQADPKGFDAGDMNLFRYCADDPVDRSDPMGLETLVSGAPAEIKQRTDLVNQRIDHMPENRVLDALRHQSGIMAYHIERMAHDRWDRAVTIAQQFQARSNGATQPEYKPGQEAVDRAGDFLADTHRELHPRDYKIRDNRLPPGWGGIALPFSKILIDTKQLYSEREVVTMVAHELMHQADGIVRTLFSSREQHDAIYRRANRIGEEYQSQYGAE